MEAGPKKIASSPRPTAVLLVLERGHFPKIFNPIVGFYPVAVIYLSFRPEPIEEIKGKPMLEINASFEFDL